MMRVIDFHCDTPKLLYERNASLRFESAMAGGDATDAFRPYVQLAACFAPTKETDDVAFLSVCGMLEHLNRCIKAAPDAMLVSDVSSLRYATRRSCAAYIPTVEDARILAGDISRVDTLFSLGVRLITPLWRGETVMGGAWNEETGLSAFATDALSRFLSLGGIVDTSHASRKAHADILLLCRHYGRAPLATHSNAYSLTPHLRNLTDEQIREIGLLGGVVGVNLYPNFLTTSNPASMQNIALHLRHIMNVGGCECAVLGSDFDGVDTLPLGISCASDLEKLATYLKKANFSSREIDRFFFKNAQKYLFENLP